MSSTHKELVKDLLQNVQYGNLLFKNFYIIEGDFRKKIEEQYENLVNIIKILNSKQTNKKSEDQRKRDLPKIKKETEEAVNEIYNINEDMKKKLEEYGKTQKKLPKIIFLSEDTQGVSELIKNLKRDIKTLSKFLKFLRNHIRLVPEGEQVQLSQPDGLGAGRPQYVGPASAAGSRAKK